MWCIESKYQSQDPFSPSSELQMYIMWAPRLISSMRGFVRNKYFAGCSQWESFAGFLTKKHGFNRKKTLDARLFFYLLQFFGDFGHQILSKIRAWDFVDYIFSYVIQHVWVKNKQNVAAHPYNLGALSVYCPNSKLRKTKATYSKFISCAFSLDDVFFLCFGHLKHATIVFEEFSDQLSFFR